jgi:hypothetical protein
LRRPPSLRSQLNQIRLWVRQGRTDAWIAHKLDVSIEQLARFKREHDLDDDNTSAGPPADPLSVPPPEDRPPERESRSAERQVRRPERETRTRSRRARPDDAREPEVERVSARGHDDRDSRDYEPADDAEPDRDLDSAEEASPSRRRRRGRRGGRRRRRDTAFEATFDHGEDGYGLWLDPAVADDPVYTEHWAGHRAVTVSVSADEITIRRAGADDADEPADEAA